MKKIAIVAAAAVLAFGLTACGSSSSAAGASTAGAAGYTDGTYTATAQGMESEVSVTVTIEGGAIASIEADCSGETESLGGVAGPQYAEAIVAAGTVDGVDMVSGSTVTCTAVQTAVNDCLTQAKA